MYTDVLRRTSSIESFPIYEPAPNYPGTSSRLPLWTNWARPTRHVRDLRESVIGRDYESNDSDFVYLLREDGAIVHLAFRGADDPNVTVGNVADCDGHLNAAFAVVPLEHEEPDTLIVAGNASNGCLIKASDCLSQVSESTADVPDRLVVFSKRYIHHYLLTKVFERNLTVSTGCHYGSKSLVRVFQRQFVRHNLELVPNCRHD